MPYAEPTSPTPSPAKETTSSRKGWFSPPSHIEDLDNGEYATGPSGPMMGIPRRSSSGNVTPRRQSPALSRTGSTSYGANVFTASKPMEGLPRRMSNPAAQAVSPTLGVAGLPTEGGSLGLKLLPSPQKAPITRQSLRGGPKDSMSSVSTQEDSLPPTPADEPLALPSMDGKLDTKHTENTFSPPTYQPPPRGTMPGRSALSPRPTLLNGNRRRSGSTSPGAAPIVSARASHIHSGSLQINVASSSTTQLEVPNRMSNTLSPPVRPAGMIRKKSGELVKPSLKQRSMSTPDLSRDAEYPSTPEEERNRGFPEERSKSVRFAGPDEADGGNLENVVLFLREQKPAAVGKAADPDRAGLTDTETEIDTDASDFVQFRTRRNAAAQKADDDKLVMEGGSKVPRVRTDFSPDSRGALKEEYVVLERVDLLNDTGPLHMKGTALVRNMSFQKWVAIRFTMDHWQTVSEVAGAHVTHIPSETTGDEGWDRFSFSIKLEDYRRKLDERQLMLCIRFSVDGREWWDSNNGMNYQFTFKKTTPRRSRPNSFGGNTFLRMNENKGSALPGLRQDRAANPAAAQIKKAFGASTAKTTDAARNWVFPRADVVDVPSRSESPISPPPPQSFRAPQIPDVHSHLSLSKRYCAPSPPTSPQRDEDGISLPTVVTPPIVTSPESEQMAVFAGGYATLAPPRPPAHERRSSWNGQTDAWNSFAQAITAGGATLEHEDNERTPIADAGDVTPVAAGSRSPKVTESSSDSSPETRPLTMKRSIPNLRALVDGNDDSGLLTPSSSDLSSPASPHQILAPMSPTSTSSTLSTGESSPVASPVTAFNGEDSALDLANLAVQIDPNERGRSGPPKMLSNSYQEFLDKFCFFQSPRMTPNTEAPIYSRAPFMPNSGSASPNGFPFYTSSTSSSLSSSTPTNPYGQYDSASDAFASVPSPLAISSPRREHGSSTNVNAGGKDGAQVTPKGSPLPESNMQSGKGAQYALGQPISDRWAIRPQDASPTLTAAQ